MNSDSSFWNFITIPVFIVGTGSMIYFLWASLHENLYKDDLDKTESQKSSSKLKTFLLLIFLIWIIGTFIFNGS